ncbi:chromosome partition protein Smc-like isoform X2 [Physella acuta]|uniref:chromosome partition protein Smc-like isoform X2 n=1 Tax=Physella acuta TaxID=109671 RepID=UPI0027DBFBC4|nr:chromosome partition protein Smc-like isoform X2 [Physella acuta]
MSEQDNKVKELNKEIESLKEKESKSNKTLEKLSLDMKEYENNFHKINKEMKDHADKTESITQEIKRHSDQMCTLQEESYKIKLNTSTQIEKHNLMYKLLQQRLMPIDKLVQIFNQNLETREKRITKLENIEDTISKLSKDLNLIESRVCNRYACHVQLAGPTPVRAGSIISRFSEVREYNGQHFNQTTGTFVSPHDGLFLVCVNLNESKDKQILVSVMAGGVWCRFIDVKSSVVVDMKKGQELYFQVFLADQGSTLSCYSSFNIVSL